MYILSLERLSHLLAKHNLGSHPESAPGRLYQAESMCSVMSMDWEYDEGMCILFYGFESIISSLNVHFHMLFHDTTM